LLDYISSLNNLSLNKSSLLEWLEYKKYNYTIAGIDKVIKLLSEYDLATQQQMVDNSIMNTYKGLFEIKKKTQDTKQSQTREAIDTVLKQMQKKKDIVVDVTTEAEVINYDWTQNGIF